MGFFSGINAPWHLRYSSSVPRGEKIKKIPGKKIPGIKVVNPRLAGKKSGMGGIFGGETGRSGGKGRGDDPCQTSKISASAICSGSGS